MEIYIRACGGSYAIISPDYPDDTCFNPFWLEDTPKNRVFLKAWLGQLLRNPHEEGLPADVEVALSNCIDYAYDSLSKFHRNLTTATQLLPLNFPRWNHLRKWLRADGIHNAGEYAYLFDHDSDQFDLKTSKIGFDMTELMQQPNSVLTAVNMYLVHRIKESLDGQRVSIYFDEGWQILDNPYWKAQLKQDLPTFRKLNAHIILATQSPESVVNSSLSAQFLDNCATNIFFCNHKANFEKHYQQFNVTSSEFEFIKNTPTEQRLFLYKQLHESAVCQLNLRGMEDILAVYSGNKATVKLVERLRKEVGENPHIWLPLFHERRIMQAVA
jgi:type IV secretion system protein VirB4